MARKTVDLDLLVQACNNVLAIEDVVLTREPVPVCSDPVSYRRGIIGVVEQALFMADAYKGFAYLSSELAHDGTLVIGYDDTRRRYTVPE